MKQSFVFNSSHTIQGGDYMFDFESNETNSEAVATATLDYWKMKNLSTCEFDSEAGFSAWSEWDKITDTSDD